MKPPLSASLARFHYHFGGALAFWGWSAGATRACRDALGFDPCFTPAYFRLGETLGRRGRWREASDAYLRAASLDPSDVETQGNLVLAFGHAGLWEEAEQALARLIRLRPGQAELHMLRGALLRRLGRPPEAIRAFRWAMQLQPSPAWERFFLGEALLGARGWAQVVESYKGALAARPREETPGGLLSVRQSVLNRHPAVVGPQRPPSRGRRPAGLLERLEGALASLTERLPAPSLAARLRVAIVGLLLPAMLGAAPPHRESLAARLQFRQCLEVEAEEAGVAACRKALELGLTPKREAIVYELLGYRFLELRKWQETTDAWRALVALRPHDPDAHVHLGTSLLYGQGRAQEALGAFEEAIRLAPDSAPAYGWRGAALHDLGRHREATAAFEEALRLDPAYFENRPSAQRVYEASRRGERWP